MSARDVNAARSHRFIAWVAGPGYWPAQAVVWGSFVLGLVTHHA